MRGIAREAEAKLLASAGETSFGDGRSIAGDAAKCVWRSEWAPTRQVRAELLRRWARENPGQRLPRESPLEWLWRTF